MFPRIPARGNFPTMDQYGRRHDSEWTASGLQEGLWQLRLGGGGGGGEGESGYPERPDEADCIYYLRTGSCGYGARCRFNHPRDRTAVLGASRAGGGDFPERFGQPLCQYYMRTGTCKFGASCKYHHPKQQGMNSVAPVTLNYLGYPLRPGEKECIYYIKTGQCKFGATCKFHHPQLANVQTPTQSLPPQPQVGGVGSPLAAAALYPAMQSPSVGSSQQYGVLVARPPLLQSSYPQVPYGPMLLSPGVVSYPSWSPYPGSVSPAASPSAQSATSIYGITQLSPSAPAYTGAYSPLPASTGPSSSSQMEQAFPERPGQPECQYYMKTGDCKFGSSCRYHHPRQLSVPKANVALSPLGLPLRPGAAVCTHYTQRGQCKFGAVCRFDHPIPTAISYSPSASSLADMPVAPYPVGSSLGTLAPSSSSSELNSGSSRDSSSSTRNRNMASSVSTQSGFIGSTFSDDTPAQHSGHLSSSSKSASS